LSCWLGFQTKRREKLLSYAFVSLAVSGAYRQEQIMARFPLFFVLAFFSMVALIVVALLPLKPRTFEAVEARAQQGGLIIDGQALSQIKPEKGFPVTPAPGPRGDQIGPRLASVSALKPDARYSKGARLLLGPRTISALKGKSFSIIIEARSLVATSAKETGFGLVTGGPIAWAQMAVGPTFAPLRFDIAASDQPVTGLAFWAATEGQGHGIEIKSITIQSLTPTLGTP
jgi:hypothetical protein